MKKFFFYCSDGEDFSLFLFVTKSLTKHKSKSLPFDCYFNSEYVNVEVKLLCCGYKINITLLRSSVRMNFRSLRSLDFLFLIWLLVLWYISDMDSWWRAFTVKPEANKGWILHPVISHQRHIQLFWFRPRTKNDSNECYEMKYYQHFQLAADLIINSFHFLALEHQLIVHLLVPTNKNQQFLLMTKH